MRLGSTLRLLSTLCAIFAATPHSIAQPPSEFSQLQPLSEQESRLRQLEQRRLPLTTQQVSTKNAYLESRVAELEELVGDLVKDLPAGGKPTQKWFGRVQFDDLQFPDNDPLPNFLETADPTIAPRDFKGFRRLRLGVSGQVTETMEYKLEMEFAEPANLEFKDAYIGWNELPALQTVLLGNQKRPYGLDNLNSSRYNVFMERPLMVEAFNQNARRMGLQTYGVSQNERWNWRCGYFLMEDVAQFGGRYTDNYQSEAAGRLANTLWYDASSGGRGYAHCAVSGVAAFPGGGPDARFATRPESRTKNQWFDTGIIAGANRYQLLGFEGVVNVGALQIVAEYQTVNLERSTGLGSDLDFSGVYVYAAYFLTGEHTSWRRNSGTIGRVQPFENFFLVNRCRGGLGGGWGAWQVAARYSHGDFTDGDIFGGVGDTVTFGMNWWWTPYSRMQFNYIFGSVDERAAMGGAPLAAGLETNGEYDMFGTRFMVDF